MFTGGIDDPLAQLSTADGDHPRGVRGVVAKGDGQLWGLGLAHEVMLTN
jgi:hypothetical protein